MESKTYHQQWYGELPQAPSNVAYRKMLIAGHCMRHKEVKTSKLVLWPTLQGSQKRGRRPMANIDTLTEDAEDHKREANSCVG